MASVDVDTRVDGDDLVVESEFSFDSALGDVGAPGRVEYNANVQVGGDPRNVLRASDTVFPVRSPVTSTSRFPLSELGFAPGDVEDLNVTVIYTRATTVGEEVAQDQFTIAVQRPPDDSGGSPPPSDDPTPEPPSLSDVDITCRGVSPPNPEPGESIVITLDTEYSGGASFPTVRFDPTIGGIGVGEVEERIGSSTQLSINANVPPSLTPGDTVEVRVEAIDIEA